MPALEALRTAVDSLVESPILFAAGLVYGLILLPQTATQLLGIPFVPFLLQLVTFFVTPFVIAGLLGMADESITEGSTSFDRFTDVGRSRYVPLLLGNLVQFGIVLVFVIAFVVVALAGAVTFGISGAAGAGAAAAGGALVFLAIVALLVLLFLVVSFFIQFYQVAIVAGEADVTDGFRESVSLVRSNLLATFGYSLVNVAVAVLTSVPVTGFVLWRSLQQSGSLSGAGTGAGGAPSMGGGMSGAAMGSLLSTTEAIALSLITLALAMVLTTFQQTYATAFYRRHDAGEKSIEERILDDENEESGAL